MPDVQVDHVTVRRLDRAALLHLLHERLREPVPRTEFHGSLDGRRVRQAQVVVLQVPVAFLVEEPAAFGARGLGDEDSGEREPRGVKLDELHILEGDPGAVGESHAVARLDVSVGRERIDLAGASRAHDDRAGHHRVRLSRCQLDRYQTPAPPLVDQEPCDEPLIVVPDTFVLERGLIESVEEVEAGLVCRVPRALELHPPEWPDRDVAVGLAAPGTAPALEPDHLLRRLRHERLDGVLVAQPVSAADGVVGVRLQAILRLHDRGRPALGHNRVAAHRIDLGDDADAQVGIGLGNGDRCPQPRTPAADHQNVVGNGLHASPSTPRCRAERIRPVWRCSENVL